MSCYWIVYDPFYFFADLDLYKTGYPVEKAVEVLDRYFDQFLVAESPTDSGGSFSVFTKRLVREKSEAAALENTLADEIDGLDRVINSSGKYLTKRALYSLHGYKRTRMLMPRLDLSKNMQDKSELELFEYSYPNVQIC